MTKEVINRHVKTDVIRGLALLLMFFAHSAPYIEDNSLTSMTIFRIICSLSAPIFLFLVGFNLKKGCNLNNLKKGLFILLSAVLIDLFIWNILPFYSFDVLYLIGFSIILFPLWLRLNKYLLFGLIVFLFTTTFIFFLAGSLVALAGMLNRGPLSYFLYKYSVQSRGEMWRTAVTIIKANPVFGVR